MKRKLLRLVMLFVTTVLTNSTFAQSSTLATLSHEGTISTYYGVTALKEAYNAAVDGDVITLASGSYLAIDLTKAVSICGAGMGLGAVKNVEPTIISGNFRMALPADNTLRFTVEGIYHNGTITCNSCKNAMFMKCRFYDFYGYGIQNSTFVHCRIANRISLSSDCNATLISSLLNWVNCSSSTTSNFELWNCILRSQVSDVKSSSLRNCIAIIDKAPIDGSNTLYNNLIFSVYENFLQNIPNQTNTIVTNAWAIFETYRTTEIFDDEDFELTDYAKENYLGNDGTEVGVYGGNLPFDTTPTNPLITKCNVASKSTADGKLSVDIEVKAAE